ncbi:tetratricopeptide repeat protein [Geoalkalibacter halelectricus]|uniref:Tetratricopeptide repeat-containing protein n=1 Tax=Geoalkalibacter halelectricus TaxID=2847045 RepID=A0ABY5ZRT3_9BACT|nr:hypothetical protein [Geoalkalibacter halelectricus]MDO3378752.1 hypothetical protein [Geoalkalibacter halelectricus]UWZ79941.1 hypothetical protein L9S41_00740 [Geoalkalibacter halelectricus]
MRKLLILFITLTLAFTLGCRREDPPAPITAPVSDPPTIAEIPPPPSGPEQAENADPSALLEFPTLALPHWRALQGEDATLVLLSQNPFLDPIPPAMQQAALNLTRTADADELRLRAAPDRPDPLLLPSQAVRAALEAEFFTRVVWLLPTTASVESLDLDIFRRQLVETGILSAPEAESLVVIPGGFGLTLAGVPVDALVPEYLPRLSGPLALHVDLSYFQILYRNEVKSPVFELMRQTLADLPLSDWDLRAATLSLGQGEGRVSADMRFLGHRLARIFAEPDMLQRPPPRPWHEHGDILYLATFLEMDRVLDAAREAAARWEEDAPLQFELYRALRTRRAGSEALDTLGRVVALDPGYAVEYLNLAALARTRELPDQELRMLKLSAAQDPRNPFPLLRMAEIHLDLGQTAAAEKLLTELAALPWSVEYYPWIPPYIASLREE